MNNLVFFNLKHADACYNRRSLVLNWRPLVITGGRLFCSKTGVRLFKRATACLEHAAACFGYAGLVFKLHDLAFILLALVNNFIKKQINVNKPHKKQVSIYEYEAISLKKNFKSRSSAQKEHYQHCF